MIGLVVMPARRFLMSSLGNWVMNVHRDNSSSLHAIIMPFIMPFNTLTLCMCLLELMVVIWRGPIRIIYYIMQYLTTTKAISISSLEVWETENLA